jgi:putative heme-binding domain-containing protein
MVLGMDGKLYYTHGDGCCSVQHDYSERQQNFDVVDKSGRHVWSDQLANTLRCNRDGTQFEIIADRQRNNYETCLNSFGNQFTSDNDDDGNRGSRVIWVMDGAKYGYRTPGSPRHWGEDVPGNVPKLVGTGNGSPCGVMVYEGTLLPKEYQGAVLEAEAGPRVIYAFPLTRRGAAFRTEIKTLLASDDDWFRPVDVTAAPDGSIFIADWYDGGVGGHAFRDQTTGRIYRVAPKGAATKAVKYNFGSTKGLIEALKSPVIAARDAARRSLIARVKEQTAGANRADLAALLGLAATGETPEIRARVAWVIDTLAAAPQGNGASVLAGQDDPRLREQAVRMLGRDVSRNGKVEHAGGPVQARGRREENLHLLLPFADDPDAGVRRELILALRNESTVKAGETLKKLARSWDGQDRWYLEALGLALRDREPAFLTELFDGMLYGDLNLAENGKTLGVALPPYFPVDRNEAFIPVGEKELPANALTKTLGLMWEVHRAEVLPLLTRLLPALLTPELKDAADDVIAQITDPAGAVALAELTLKTNDPVSKRQYLETLGRKLEGPWRPAQGNETVIKAIESALADPKTRAEGIQAAAASGDARYARALSGYISDEKAPAEVRVAAIEAVGRLHPPGAARQLQYLIIHAKERKSSNPAAEAAVRALARLGHPPESQVEIVLDGEMPLGLRRVALRTLAQRGYDGGMKVVAMAQEDKLPDDLKTEATSVLSTHPDGRVRHEAMQVLPPPKAAGGKPLPPFYELVRREGHPDKGRDLFFRSGTNACGGCHRVQGRGQWVGPDLSTIGTKYGKDELLRSILNPSASIPYSFHSLIVATKDGRVLTGLPVEETPDRLVLKTADGQRIALRTPEIEDRKQSEVSLMPEGLAETMGEQDLVDVLAFLTTLKQPVSIVGQFQALGPVKGDTPPSSDAWRRVSANAEGLVDLVPLVGTEPSQAVFLQARITSPIEQPATLVLDTKADVRAWFRGKPVELPAPNGEAPRSVSVTIPTGPSELQIRLPGGEAASIVATFVARTPLEFSSEEERKAP